MSRTLTKQEISEFLKKNPVMSIGATMGEMPISSVVVFVADENFHFAFLTKKDTYKARALAENPNISFSVWEKNNMIVQGAGKAKILDDIGMNQVVDRLVDTATGIDEFWPPILSIEGDAYIAYEIIPEWLRAMNLKDLNINEKQEVFTQIEV